MPAHDMQDRAENLAREPLCAVDLEGAGREEGAVLGSGRQRALVEKTSVARHPLGVPVEGVSCCSIDDPHSRRPRSGTSTTTCSASVEESTIIAFCPPVSAINGTIGPERRDGSDHRTCSSG